MKRASTRLKALPLLALLLGPLPAPVEAGIYTIKEFTQTSASSVFSDAFDDGSPPAPPTYEPFGTFLPGDESGGVLNLVTSRGEAVFTDRDIGAGVADPTYFFSPGTAGSVEALFVNLAPLPNEGYGIGIEALSDVVDDEAFLFVTNSGGLLMAVFDDETGPLGTFNLTGVLTEAGTGELGLRLELSTTGVVTAFVDRDGSGGSFGFDPIVPTSGLGPGPHTGGFDAFEVVPEPGTLLLVGSGLAGLVGWSARRRCSKQGAVPGASVAWTAPPR